MPFNKVSRGFLLLAFLFTCGLGLAHSQDLQPPQQDWVLRFTAGISSAIAPMDPVLNLGDAFTMEAWIYPETREQCSFIMSKFDYNTGAWYGIEYWDSTIAFRQWALNAEGVAGYSAPQAFETKKWMHVAATRSADGAMRLFINGVQVAQGQSPVSCESTQGPLVIGPLDGAVGAFWGAICQARVWNYALTSEQIQSNAGKYLSGGEPGLIAYWPLDDGPGHTARNLTSYELDLKLPYNDTPGYYLHPRWVRTSVLSTGPYLESRRRLATIGPLIDFDSDGDNDVVGFGVLGDNPYYDIFVCRNDGNNNFEDLTTEFVIRQHPLTQYVRLNVFDANHDGRQDLFVTQSGRPLLFIQSVDGKLVDETDARIPAVPEMFATFSSASGDIDGDGDLDIFIGNIDGSIPCFFMNDGNGYFELKTEGLPDGMNYSSGVLIDVDHDCDLDLVLGDRGGTIEKNAAILLNDGCGSYAYAPSGSMPSRTGTETWWTPRLDSADINSDGYPDLVLAVGECNAHSIRVLVYLNNGDGTFRDESHLIPFEYLVPDSAVWATVADINEDGRPDLLIHGNVLSFFYLNTGDADSPFVDSSDLFDNASASGYSFLAHNQGGAVFGDFEGDGDTDIMLVSPDTGMGFPFVNRKPWPMPNPLPYPFEANLISPMNASDHLILPTLHWTGVATAGFYQLQVATDQYFNNIVFDRNGLTCSSHQPSLLTKGKDYYWRVRAINTRGAGPWSEVWSFYYGDIIPYTFEGFFSPIENTPVVNQAKAGQTIPVKWRILDKDGLPVSDPASFVGLTSYPVSCSTFEGDPTNPVEESAAGDSGLQYLGDGWWQYNWKTSKAYAGQCRTMKLSLDDKTEHTASFSFK